VLPFVTWMCSSAVPTALTAGTSRSPDADLAAGAVVAAAVRPFGVLVNVGLAGLAAFPVPAVEAVTPAFLAGPGLAADGVEAKFRRAAAGDGAATPLPRTLCAPLPLLDGAAGGDVLGGETTALAGCNFSDLLEALDGVRLSGSFAGGEAAAGFLGLLAAAGGVRLAEGSLAEN
jgi:hypothetical protein